MKPLSIFYILLCYVFLQFCWWAWLLVDLNDEVYTYKAENIRFQNVTEIQYRQQQALLKKKLHAKWWMVAGEGTVFVCLLGFGAHRTLKAFKQEVALNKQQQNFLLAITHELKSPLASIKLQLQTIQKRALEAEKQEKIINNAISDADRLNILIEKTLLAAQIESAKYNPHKSNIDINNFIEKLLKNRSSTLAIEKQLLGDIYVNADELGLTSVFLNLIENAEKYAAPGSTLYITSKVKRNEINISFADEGVGIPDMEKKHVLKKFYRVGNEKTRTTKGTGLGLFIVKQIIEQHNGRIVIKDNKPVGTIFEVYLPLA